MARRYILRTPDGAAWPEVGHTWTSRREITEWLTSLEVRRARGERYAPAGYSAREIPEGLRVCEVGSLYTGSVA